MKSLLVSVLVSFLAPFAFAQDVPAGGPSEPAPVPEPAPVAPVPASAPVPTPVEREHVVPAPAPTPFAAWSTRKLTFDLELVSHGRYASVPGTNLSELRLDRGELGARVGLGAHAAAELRLEAIRSASDGGALGIDGNSTVVRVKYANVAGSTALGPSPAPSSITKACRPKRT